jgi:hypothetical protein
MRAFTRRPIERDSLETSALPRTDSPSLHSCSASGSASSFLLASALSLHEPLRTPEAEDARCVQPTSATRTNDVHPSAVRSRLSRAAFTTRDAPQQSVAVTLHDRGNEHFHDARSALASFATTLRTRSPRALVLTALGHERRPVRLCGARWDETSDTSVANPSSSSRSRHFRACSRVPRARPYGFGRRVRVGRVRSPPRPSSSPAREDRRLQMIRGAFHRQGPFIGSGGHYSPGPATAAPLLAMLRPLDDALTSPWALSRSRAVVVRLDPGCDSSFRSMRSQTFDRPRSPRPRPPFARP